MLPGTPNVSLAQRQLNMDVGIYFDRATPRRLLVDDAIEFWFVFVNYSTAIYLIFYREAY